MKRSSLLFLLLVFSVCISAQQLPLLSQYQINGQIINPAFTGADQTMQASVTYRRQWQEMPQAPQTASASFKGYLWDYNTGLGGYLIFDKTGPTSFSGINLQYAYHLDFNSNNNDKLSMGLSMALVQYRLKGSELLLDDPNDPLVFDNNKSKILPDAGAGILYHNDYLYAGFSVPQMLSLNVMIEGENGISNLRRVAHFYGMAGGKFPFGYNHTFEPSVWYKYTPVSPWHIDINARTTLNETIILGLGYSTSNTAMAEVGALFEEKYRIAYAISFPFNKWQAYLGFSHEFMFTYIIDNGSYY